VGQCSPQSRTEHGVRRGFGINWRYISAVIVAVLSVVLVLSFVTDFFYVRSVQVAGVIYLDASEVFRYADIAESHIFWVDPEEVRQNILDATNVIADAQVTIGWPPDMVRIVIQEREPALVWIQSGVASWVDLQGRVLRQFPQDNGERSDLIRVVADDSVEGPPGGSVLVDTEAIAGALQLQTLLQGLSALRYNPTDGLGFREPAGWDVWFGVGTDMRDKLLIYEALTQDFQARGFVPTLVNVANPDAVVYCCRP
jgi:cell division septal protein FtsQ